MVTTGSRIFCVWLGQGPQSNGQPLSTAVFWIWGATRTGGIARVASYQPALFDSCTSCAPCASQVLRIQTPPSGDATTSAGTAFLHTLHRLVVWLITRSAGFASSKVTTLLPGPNKYHTVISSGRRCATSSSIA